MDLIAPVSATTASRPLPMFGDGALSIGQLVQARVTRVDGDTVQLRWGDQTVSVASRAPLAVGQQVSLMVEEGSAGKMLLRMVDDTFGKGKPARGETPGIGRSTNTTTPATGGRQMPVTGLPGGEQREAGGSAGGQAAWGGPDSGEAGTTGGRSGGPAGQARAVGNGAAANGARPSGAAATTY